MTRLPHTKSGIFIRFKNPEAAGLYNPAWSAVSSGFEIQIDNTGAPDGWLKHRTGAVYGVNYPNDPNQNPGAPAPVAGDFVKPQVAAPGSWNAFSIEAQGDVIAVAVNGVASAKYTNADPARGRFLPGESTFVGLQAYSNYSFTTAFRNVQVTSL